MREVISKVDQLQEGLGLGLGLGWAGTWGWGGRQQGQETRRRLQETGWEARGLSLLLMPGTD